MRTPLLAIGLVASISGLAHATDVGGAITTNTTWTLAGSPYVVTSTVTVSNNATLTIDPGVSVRFKSGVGLTLGAATPGILNAVGTGVSPITFDADPPFPSPGFWNGILFTNTTSASILRHCLVDEAGAGTNDAGVRIASGNVTVRDTTVRRTDGYGIYVTGAGVQPSLIDVVVDANTSYPLHVEIANWPSALTGMAFTSNGIQAVEVVGGTLANNLTLPSLGVPYVVTTSITVQGSLAPTLTIGPGQTLRFKTSAALTIGSSALGKLVAQGSVGQPILFTSDQASPAPGNWTGLRFADLTLGSSILQHCTVEYAGQGTTTSVDVTSCEPTIADVTIRKGLQDGLNINTAGPTVQNVSIVDAGRYGVQVLGASTATLQNLIVTNPVNYGVFVSSTTAAGSLSGSSIANSIQFTGVTTMSVTGNTFSNYNAFPARIEAESVGGFLANNTLQGVVAGTSTLEVLADTIVSSATWPNLGVRYVMLGSVSIVGPQTPVLTLAAGTQLRFAAGFSLTVGGASTSAGGLIAQGTVGSPIVFTANTASPTPGFWGRILFEDTTTSTSLLEYCTVEYAGTVALTASVCLDTGSLTLRNVTVRHSAQDGVLVNVSSSSIENLTVDNCVRYGIQITGAATANIQGAAITNVGNYGVFVSSATAGGSLTGSTIANSIQFTGLTSMSVTGNTFSNYDAFPTRLEANSVGPFLTNNTLQGVVPGNSRFEVLADTVTQSQTWPSVGVFYLLLGNVGVSSSFRPTLTIAPGAVLKFNAGLALTVGSGQPGALIATGTQAQPIVFTSSQTTPTPGFWSSVRFETSALPTSRLEHCTLEYGGSADSVLYVNGGAPTLDTLTVRFSTFDGVRLRGGTLATLEDTTIANLGRYGVFIDGTTAATVRNIVVDNPVNYGFLVSTATAGGSLENSDIEHAIQFTGVSTMTVTGNTFRDYAAFPARVGANTCGALLNNNTFLGVAVGTSIVEVLAETISSSATWPNLGMRYVLLGSFSISGTSTPLLTLAQGVEVRMNSAVSLTVGSTSATTPGGLLAVGTVGQPILFTANTGSPTPGFWGRILFEDSALATSRLERCTVEYGGSSAAGALVFVDVSAPTLKNVTLRQSLFDGLQLSATAATVDGATIDACGRHGVQITGATTSAMTGVVVTNTANYGILVSSSTTGGSLSASNVANGIQFTGVSSMSVTGNTFSNYNAFPTRIGARQVASFLAGNTLQGIVAGTSVLEVLADTMTQSGTWPAMGLNYVMLGIVTVSSPTGTTLTLPANAKLRFRTGAGLNVGQSGQPGTLLAQGTLAQPVTFTTDNVSPAPGQWIGVHFVNTTASSLMDFCVVEYAGATNAADVRVASSRPVIRRCTLRNSSAAGLSITGGAPVVENNTITANVTGVNVGASASHVTRLADNDIAGNSTAGLASAQATGFDARVNWWGHASGPSGIGSGSGNSITGAVLFEPWLSDPASTTRNWISAAASPDPFSQNGGSTSFLGSLEAAANWQIDVRNSVPTIVRTFTGSGASFSVDWAGDDGSAVPLPNGNYTYEVQATAIAGGTFSRLAGNLTLDNTLGIAKIDLPDALQMIGSAVTITGKAAGTGFTSYTVQVGAGFVPSTFSTVGSGSSPVNGGTLATWTPTAVQTAPVYTLRLTTTTSSGTLEDRVSVRLLKITSLSASPTTFSPNNDGTLDTTVVSAAPTWPADWTLNVINSSLATVRSLTGSGDVVAATWDGRDNGSVVVPDGQYTYTLIATDTPSGVSSSANSVTPLRVDVTPPTALIASPTHLQTVLSAQNFTVKGQATDANFSSFTLAVGAGNPAASFTQIASSAAQVPGTPPNDVLGTWIVSQYDPGLYTARLTALDTAGNTTVFDRAVNLDHITITDIFAYPEVFDVSAGGQGTVYFTVNKRCDAVVRIYAWPGATLVRTLNMPGLAAGERQIVWNGRDDANQFSSLYKASYVTITASDGFGRDGFYNSGASPIFGALGAWGPFSVDSTGFDPYANDEIEIQYSALGWMTNQISATGTGLNRTLTPFGIIPPATLATYWDGRNQSGTFHSGAFSFYFGVPATAPATAFYVDRPAVRFADFRAQAYLIHPTFGEISTFEFDLTAAATVNGSVRDPNGNHVRTLYTNASLAAGPHSIEWNGRDDNGRIVAVEGNYRIALTALDPLTGLTFQRTGSITVYR